MEMERMRLDRISTHLAASCKELLLNKRHRVELLAGNLPSLVMRRMMAERHRTDMLEQRANALDPRLLLKRGYSFTLHEGKIVRDASTLKPGDEIETRLEKGRVTSIVSGQNTNDI
jgi:exodeoxyribonuclease VII large subunit